MYSKREFPWFGVLVALVLLALVAGVVWLILADINEYDRACRERGGRTVEIHGSTICVDENDRVILI